MLLYFDFWFMCILDSTDRVHTMQFNSCIAHTVKQEHTEAHANAHSSQASAKFITLDMLFNFHFVTICMQVLIAAASQTTATIA
jgi:hypothetical protein